MFYRIPKQNNCFAGRNRSAQPYAFSRMHGERRPASPTSDDEEELVGDSFFLPGVQNRMRRKPHKRDNYLSRVLFCTPEPVRVRRHAREAVPSPKERVGATERRGQKIVLRARALMIKERSDGDNSENSEKNGEKMSELFRFRLVAEFRHKIGHGDIDKCSRGESYEVRKK